MKSALRKIQSMLDSAFSTFDAWRDRAEVQLDAAADESLRTWLRLFALVMVATVGVVALLRLGLTAAVGGGPVARWVAASVAALLASVLLIVVVRNVIISLVEPAHRRSLLLAFLTAAAAVMVSVEAFAAITAAMAGGDADLWAIERLYMWHLVDSVPLLDIAGRLEWTEPPVLPGIDGRLLILGFKLVVIPPLVRVAVAVYALVESRTNERRYSAAVASKIGGRRIFRFVEIPVWLLLLATGAGTVWSVIEPGADVAMPWFSWTSLMLVGTVIAMMVAAAFGIWAFQRVRALPAVLTLAAAVALVWFGSPVLPGIGGRGPWSKIGITLLVWLVVTVLLLVFLWDEEELPNDLVAVAFLLGFVGSDAPATRWLTEHVTWTPWDFPVGRAIITACWGLSATFFLYLMWRVLRRPAVLGTSDWASPSSGLREDLRGYALIGVHIVIAAAAVLTLLRAVGAVDVRAGATDAGWTSASESLAAVTWHLVGSFPGPNIPQILDWQLATDFGGPWAGLVIVIALTSIIVFVAFPMIRTIVLWARLTATRPSTAQPLVEVPAAILGNLRAVLAFLEAWERDRDGMPGPSHLLLFRWSPPPAIPGQRRPTEGVHDAERRLVASELDRPRLLDLLGERSPIYIAADHAILRTADAYRAALRTRATTGQAREAVDEFASLVERWQETFKA
ncbi:hypothetical protein [Micromonospora sp. NPDC047740]|uniref:hypothetical protein n=1 Tax=Micromonospora sp. NPDC047740 TaxID=3364254 RepID=UPI00371AAA90